MRFFLLCLIAVPPLAARASDEMKSIDADVALSGVICPPKGTVAVQGLPGTRFFNQSVWYDGADPSDPSVCLSHFQDGRQVRTVANLVSTASEEKLGLATLFPLSLGRKGSARYRLRVFLDVDIIVQVEWQVIDEDSVRLGEELRPVWVVKRINWNVASPEAPWTRYYYVDKATGVPLIQFAIPSARDRLRSAQSFLVTELSTVGEDGVIKVAGSASSCGQETRPVRTTVKASDLWNYSRPGNSVEISFKGRINSIKAFVPVYPPASRRNRIEGQVMLKIRIDKEGKVSCANLANRADYSLAASAIRNVMDWEFEPFQRNGVPSPLEFEIPFTFSLDPSDK